MCHLSCHVALQHAPPNSRTHTLFGVSLSEPPSLTPCACYKEPFTFERGQIYIVQAIMGTGVWV